MNIKNIFIFIICVVLPNRLYSRDKDGNDTEINRKSVIEYWLSKNQNNTNGAIVEDDEGNLLIKLAVKTGSPTSGIFVLQVRRIGIYLGVQTRPGSVEANKELIDYFAKILGVPKSSLEIVAGLNATLKTLKLSHGFLSINGTLEKLVDECVELIRA